MSNYRNKSARLAGMFKALSNPNRLRIFMKLAKCCPPAVKADVPLPRGQACACVGDLGKDLGIVPSTVSHHIKELNRAGLIEMERDGQTIRCSIAPGAVEEVTKFFRGMNGG